MSNMTYPMSRVWALRAEHEDTNHFLLAWSEEGALAQFDALTEDLGIPTDRFTVDWCQMEIRS